MSTYRTGIKGETAAVLFLKSKGYEILTRNFRWGRCEIDIIAETPQKDTIVFIEVKCWMALSLADLEFSITPRKRHVIKQVSFGYMNSQVSKYYQFIRYDVIFIHENRIHHLEGAF